jgi:hypothetical protein
MDANMLLNRLHLPDMSSLSTPDVGGLTDDILELAESAADAISSAAGHLPGLEDYRAIARRRRTLSVVGAVALVAVIVVVLRRRRRDDRRAGT